MLNLIIFIVHTFHRARQLSPGCKDIKGRPCFRENISISIIMIPLLLLFSYFGARSPQRRRAILKKKLSNQFLTHAIYFMIFSPSHQTGGFEGDLIAIKS